MESCKRKVNSHSVSRSVYLMSLFDWKLVNEEKKENAPSTLYFERDENVPYYQEMVLIEKEASPHLIPFWFLIVFVGLAFGLVTAALIISLLKIPGFGQVVVFLSFFVPAAVCLAIDVLLFYIRNKQLFKYLENETKIVEEAEKKMADLRKRYGSQENKN